MVERFANAKSPKLQSFGLAIKLIQDGSGGGTRTPDTRIMIKLFQLLIFDFICLQAHKLGVLKSV